MNNAIRVTGAAVVGIFVAVGAGAGGVAQAQQSTGSPVLTGSGVAAPAFAPAPQPQQTQQPQQLSSTAPGNAAAAKPFGSEKSPLPFDVTVRFGLGTSTMRYISDLGDERSWGGDLNLDLGVRVHPFLAIGVHGGVLMGVSRTDLYYFDGPPMPGDDGGGRYQLDMTPLELGASLQMFPTDWLWMSPWLGITQLGRGVGSQPTAGFAIGVDVLRSDEHRLGAYVRGTQTSGFFDDTDDLDYDDRGGARTFTFGAAYSFR